MSTSAEIGRSPMAMSRSASHARARPVGDAADDPAEEERAGRLVRSGEMHGDGTGEAPRHRVGCEFLAAASCVPAVSQRLEPSQPGGGEVAGDAAHAEAIGAVRRHLDVEHGIVEPDRLGEGLADGEPGGQLDDAFAILGQAQLVARAQHAVRGDAADRAGLEHDAGARNERARRREHAEHAGARIGRAAHHLDLARAGIDDAELELVGVGMRLGLDHARDPERRQVLGAVLDALDLEPAHDQKRGDLLGRRRGVEMGLEPGERRLHRAGPVASDGTSSGRKP